MYPPIEPFKTGHLPVGDGHEIYWEASGNPDGRPAVFLHGGPGGGIKTGYRRRFDPEKFLIISFEQRGCGRSRPSAGTSESSLNVNTTQALIADIECLRRYLKVERWLVTGVSWGTTLSIAYAQAHSNRVTGLVLAAVTTTSASEINWLTEEMSQLFPCEWEKFRDAVCDFPGTRLIDRYYEAITHPNPKIREAAARAWCDWEDIHPSLDPNFAPNTDFKNAKFRLEFSTLVIHYWKHAAFLKEKEILSQMHRISEIPGVLIHGRYDVSLPLRTVWDLHKAWPASKLVIIADEGHGGPKMMEEMARAISKIESK